MTASIPWIGTSWKMHKLRAEAREYARILAQSDLARSDAVRLFVIPPFTAVSDTAVALAGTAVTVGAQNMHWADAGAWTGEISAAMLLDAGATLVELGHSERRTHFGETDETVALKTAAALRHGLIPLVCVGDTREEYEARRTARGVGRASAGGDVQDHARGRRRGGVRLRACLVNRRTRNAGRAGVRQRTAPVHQRGPARRHRPRPSRSLRRQRQPGQLPGFGGRDGIDGLFIGRSAWDAHGYLGIVASVLGAGGS